MPSNEVELLSYRRRESQRHPVNIRRTVSEDCLLDEHEDNHRPIISAFSMLKLSKTRITVGDSVTVYWDIREHCGANDWIGLFDLDSPTSLSNYLACKQRGITGAKRGAIKWAINRDVTFGEVENKCIFKYIHGNTGSVKAISPTLYIYNPYAELASPHGRPRLGSLVPQETLLEFSIAGLQANGLKKNIFGRPSPYVKLSIMPSRRHLRSWKQHHGQIAKTSSQTNTTNPKWNSEEFVFLGGAEDLLEVEVRNKFSGTRPAFSRFLGKLTVPLVDLFGCQRNRPEEFTKPLGRRTPADRIQGTVTLTVTVIEPSKRPQPGAESGQQENIPPSTPASGSQQTNPSCTLSNPSLTSSAPNILQPLTLNSSNGVLETTFPVENTPSPESPRGANEQPNPRGNGGHRRLRLHSRPRTEIYSHEFVPLDPDITSPEISRDPHIADIENSVSGNSTADESNSGDNRTSNSIDVESPNEITNPIQDCPSVVHSPDEGDSNNTVVASATSLQDSNASNQDMENQPMEIPHETSDVSDSDVVTETPVVTDEVEMALPSTTNRNSVTSIELTDDSPLRILEESERVREEIALSCENLLQEPSPESDDELEQMDVSDDTILEEQNDSLNSDYSMEDVLTRRAGTATESNANDNSLETQSRTVRETHVLEAGDHPSSPEDQEESRTSTPPPVSSDVTASFETETEAEAVNASERVSLQSEHSQHQDNQSESQRSEQEDVQMSLLEYVDRIVGDESNDIEEQSADNAMIVQSFGDNTEENVASVTSGVRIPSVTLPVEASEPVLLDATSLQSASASEMLVDTSANENTITPPPKPPRGNENPITPPPKPPRGKRVSRSSSEPRNSQRSHRGGERSRNASRTANQEGNASRQSRPPFVRRVTDPTTGQANRLHSEEGTVNRVNDGTTAAAITVNTAEDSTSYAVPLSPTESVVMAVPLSPPPQRPTHSGLMSPVVVVDGRAEPEAVVTPLPSPELSFEGTDTVFDDQLTVTAASVNSEGNQSIENESSITRDLSNDYELIIQDDGRQPSSAPSTLRREAVPSNATVLPSVTRVQHRRSSSQDSTPSAVIYATPVTAVSRESTDGSLSFPRAKVTALSENRRQGSGETVSGETQSLPRNSSNVVPIPSASGPRESAEQSRSDATPRVNSGASVSATSQPESSASSSSDANQREAIQTLLRSYYFKSSQASQGTSSVGQPTSSTSPVRGQAGGRRPSSDTNPRSAQRRNSARRQQGHPVHLSIEDQQQTRGQQARSNQQSVEEEPLPSNWERGIDSHGRVYYIDHINRTTTWVRPRRNAPEREANMNDINTHWQSLDRRYQSFRRTLRGRGSHHSRPPLPIDNNRENQTTGETSASSNSETSSLSRPSSSASSTQPSPTPSTSSDPSTPSTSTAPSPSSASSARASSLNQSPAVKFLIRYDLIDYLKSKGVAGHYYFQSQMLKLIVSKIRSDPNQFERYRHQVELVRFLNQFADPQMDMPPGWDKKVDQSGRLYFIDHNSRTTTFIDPRLPVEETLPRRNRSESEPYRGRLPPSRPPPPISLPQTSTHTSTPPMTYNQQVIGFLSQPNIDEILKNKFQGYSSNPSLKANVRRVKTEGERALGRLSSNLDFNMLISAIHEDVISYVPVDLAQTSESLRPMSPTRHFQASSGTRSRASSTEGALKGAMAESPASSSPAPYKRDFEAKVRSFHRQLYHKGYGQGPNKIKMSIRRDHILEDAYDQIMKEPARNLQRNRLEIQFTGEEGLDYGGPAREFFFLLSRQVFNPYYGLFEYSANDTYTVQVSPVSLYVDNSHEWFRFCGRIIGLVIIHQHLLDAFFTRPFYKALLRSLCDLSDVEAMDSLFHQSMTWVMENDITGALDLSFTVSEEIFGEVTERELVPGGKEMEVTEENKHEYVEQMVRWRVERGVAEQTESIVNGFNEVLDPKLINLFDARELELVISGTADIDIEDWRKNTEYRSGYHGNHKVIRWFWKVVKSFDNEQKLRLLQFVTGTSSIPYEGFTALRGSTGPRKFCIERWGDYTKLPRAHTCFNRLDLPLYRSYEELLEKLTFAVEESETFAMQ